MLARRPSWAALACLIAAALAPAAAAADTSDLVSRTEFRVCADPANMPFSDKAGEGFENKIAELLASKLNEPVAYTWFPQATGFVRRTLQEARCDVIMGYSQGNELVQNTNHYYTSVYVLVVKADGPLAGVDHLDDPLLQGKHLGVVAGSPPATVLARNGLIALSRPYPLFVDRRFDSPAETMLADLAKGEIDGAILWGPIGGYFAQKTPEPVKVIPLLHEEGSPKMYYRITMGVRQGELTWKRKLDSLLRRNKADIEKILRSYGVPLVDDYGRDLLQ